MFIQSIHVGMLRELEVMAEQFEVGSKRGGREGGGGIINL